MNKMQKLTCARVLKIIFYLLGFPLLLLFVAKDSMVFFDEGAFSETAKAGITGVFVLWLGFSAVQLGLYLVMKKQQALRTVILAILAIALMLVPVAGLNARASKQIEDTQAAYANKSKAVVVKDYYQQSQWFNTLSVDKPGEVDRFNDAVTEFIRVYGLEEYYPHIYRARTQVNTPIAYFETIDGKRYEVNNEDGSKIFDKIKEDSPFAYNPNGLLYDGYIFGVENAVKLLIEYNNFKNTATTTRQVGWLEGSTPPATVANPVYISSDAALQNKYKVVINTSKADGSVSPTFVRFDADKHIIAGTPADGQFLVSGALYEVLTIDDALTKAIETAEASQAWIDYTTTETFGTDAAGAPLHYDDLQAVADDIVLTADRLDAVLGRVFEYLGKSQGLNALFEGLHAADLIAMLGDLGISIGEAELGVILGGLRYPGHYLLGDIVTLETTEKQEEWAAWLLDPDGDAATTETMADYEANGQGMLAALTFLLRGLDPILPLLGGLLGPDTLLDLVGGLVPGLDLGSILNAVLLPGTLQNVMDALFAGLTLANISVDGVSNLLMGLLGGLSFYQHPLLKMSWDSQFMSDGDKALVTDDGSKVDLSRYAWVKYTCEKWGITNGCALVAPGGLLTGSTLGNGASADDAFTLDELYQMEADISYMPDTYPLFAARRYMYIWAGLMAMSIFFTAYFYKKEQTYLYQITLDGGEF